MDAWMLWWGGDYLMLEYNNQTSEYLIISKNNIHSSANQNIRFTTWK